MVDRDDLDQFSLQTIHETIIPVENFAEGVVANLGYNATGLGEQLKPTDCCNESFGQKAGVTFGVTSHIGPDRLNVFRGLESPDDRRHFKRRFLASSCVIVSPASACSSPRWIFARK